MDNYRLLPFDDYLTAASFSDHQLLFDEKNWQLWKTEFKRPFQEAIEYILFFKNSSGYIDVESAREYIKTYEKRNIYYSKPKVVIAPKSRILNNQQRIMEILSIENSKQIVSLRSFLWKGAYLNNINDISYRHNQMPSLEHFVEPSIRTPHSNDDKPAVDTLLEWLLMPLDEEDEQSIGVLLGGGGIGKTTVAMAIFDQLVKFENPETLPLFINSKQWATLVERKELTLRDIWRTGFEDLYDTTLNPKTMDVCLSTGIIVPIFDGFDELCNRFGGYFNAQDVIEELRTIFTNGKILLTSRSQFWDDSVIPFFQKFVLHYNLRSFTPDNRMQYLEKRFPNNKAKQIRSEKILQRIEGHIATSNLDKPMEDADTHLTNIPVIVVMAAYSADFENELPSFDRYGTLLENDPIFGLLSMLCEREIEKADLKIKSEMIKGINFSTNNQLTFIQRLASEFGPTFNDDDIELAAMETFIKSTTDDQKFLKSETDEIFKKILKQLKTYVFFDKHNDKRKFRFEFLYDYLIARIIHLSIFCDSSEVEPTLALRRALADDGEMITHLGQMVRSNFISNWKSILREKWNRDEYDSESKKGFLSIILGLCSLIDTPQRVNATENLVFITNGNSGNIISELDIYSSIKNFDFRSTIFQNCTFSDNSWVKCKFDKNSKFKKCNFIGKLSFIDCSGFELCEISDDNYLTPETKNIIQKMQKGTSGSLPIDKKQIEHALYLALEKFQQGLAFRSVKYSVRYRGQIQNIKFAKEVWEQLEKSDLVKELHKGNSYRISDDSITNVAHFLNDKMITGKVKIVYDKLCKSLIK